MNAVKLSVGGCQSIAQLTVIVSMLQIVAVGNQEDKTYNLSEKFLNEFPLSVSEDGHHTIGNANRSVIGIINAVNTLYLLLDIPNKDYERVYWVLKENIDEPFDKTLSLMMTLYPTHKSLTDMVKDMDLE